MKRLLLLFLLLPCTLANASQLPPGFVEKLLAQNLDPTDMVIAPDGRIFIAIKSGKIVIIENGVLSTTPLLNIPVYTYNEAGLCHIALDPSFSTNHYYYVYYTTPDSTHNRISRFTANGNSTLAGSETILLDLDHGTVHDGGDMIFGLDGKLYISTGDGDDPNNSQKLESLLGKVLRINSDGTIPSDNPFYNDATVVGKNKAIWASGFRNPFSMDIQRGTGKIFVSDVGEDAWEEINEVQPGKNYGWPLIEGMITTQQAPTNYQDPFYVYAHGFTEYTGCALVGAAFYDPTIGQFPDQYLGQFFFADYCQGWINYINPTTGAVHQFATNISRPVAILVGPDGSLYYLARAGSADDNTSTLDGTLWKVNYTGSGAPAISVQPQNVTATEGDTTKFSFSASGARPLAYQWMVNDTLIVGATSVSYSIANVQVSDDGKKFRCIVSNSFGSDTTQNAILHVTTNTPPHLQLTVTLPNNATLYQAGQTMQFSGTANDAEDGALPPSAFTWRIDFHHDQHIHPGLQPTSGITSGSLYLPRLNETSDNVWYRVILTATDSKGLSSSIYQDVFPQKVKIILNTTPPNLTLNLDGQPKQTPDTVTMVVGITRSLEAPPTQTISGNPYLFSTWSQSGLDRLFTFNGPEANKSFNAAYSLISVQPQQLLVKVGYDANFSIPASGAQPFLYQWLMNGTPIANATKSSYTFTNAKLTDDGKRFSCKVSNSFGSVTTQDAILHVSANAPPRPQLTVTLPNKATLYQAGQTMQFNGSANDVEDGVLPPSALTWKINFYHKQQIHTAMKPIAGIVSGSFNIPRVGETDDDVWYRVILIAKDSKGVSDSVYQDVLPQKVKIILNTTPPNLTLNLDGQPKQTPDTVTMVVGVTRSLEAPATQTNSGNPHLFSNWTQSELDRVFTFNAPEKDKPFNATYTVILIQPKDTVVEVGDNATFAIPASGAQPFSYQWLANDSLIFNATSASYTFTNAQLKDDGKKISCKVSNTFGSVITPDATLNVKKSTVTGTEVSSFQAVYPNPALNEIIYSRSGNTIVSIEIINNLGQSLKQLKDVNGDKIEIDISDLHSGSYILLISHDSQRQAFHFIKR